MMKRLILTVSKKQKKTELIAFLPSFICMLTL